MIDDSYHMNITKELLERWQEILDDLAQKANIPCATITRVDYPEIEGFLTSNSPDNPATAGDRSLIAGTYCERVINTNKEMLIPNALKIPEWENNPDIEYFRCDTLTADRSERSVSWIQKRTVSTRQAGRY